MVKFWNFWDGLGDWCDELGNRLGVLLGQKGQQRILWLFIGFLLFVGFADNMTSVSRIWEMLPASGAVYDEAGKLIPGSAKEMGWALEVGCSVAMTLLFFACEKSLIQGFRNPNKAARRFAEANRYNIADVNPQAPTSAGHFWKALKHGEMFDIRFSQAMSWVVFVLDGWFQFMNRTWEGNGAVIAFNFFFGVAMLIGTEVCILLIDVASDRKYSELPQAEDATPTQSAAQSPTQKEPKQGGKKTPNTRERGGHYEMQDPKTGQWFRWTGAGWEAV